MARLIKLFDAFMKGWLGSAEDGEYGRQETISWYGGREKGPDLTVQTNFNSGWRYP